MYEKHVEEFEALLRAHSRTPLNGHVVAAVKASLPLLRGAEPLDAAAEQAHCERVVDAAKGGRYGCGWVVDLVLQERAALRAQLAAALKAEVEAAFERGRNEGRLEPRPAFEFDPRWPPR